jgi:hypothetical protein
MGGRTNGRVMDNEVAPINSEGNYIPDNTLLVISANLSKDNIERIESILQPLVGKGKRDWFTSAFYSCLPLRIGNQYGFIICAEYDFSVLWNGGDKNEDLIVTCNKEDIVAQQITSHFGNGIFIIDNNFAIRTSPGVNIMTIAPPNFIKRGVYHMSGVVELDNLRRNFVFGIKVTEPNYEITYKKGDPIAAFIPIPRYFVDNFSIEFAHNIFTHEQIELENLIADRINDLKETKNLNGCYFRGEDFWGEPFLDHQKHIKKPKKKDNND